MSLIVAIIVCLVMSILTVTGVWKANKYGVAALWVLLAMQCCMLYGLTESYKSVVLMLNR